MRNLTQEVLTLFKGIHTHEDAFIASKFSAVKGIILSNHGGRALDTANTPIQVLLEIKKFCPQIMSQVEIWLDGGIKRGSDVVKALALGARGVGLGRAALYGLAVGGEDGVSRSLQSMFPSHKRAVTVLTSNPVLADETITTMRLLGASCVSELRPQHVSLSVSVGLCWIRLTYRCRLIVLHLTPNCTTGQRGLRKPSLFLGPDYRLCSWNCLPLPRV